MACVNTQNPDCPNCNKSGLAILPVRYAVVPQNIATSLPPSLGDKITSVKLGHHKYVLRTLRQGFVYIFHDKHPRGSHIKWEIYSVSTRGTLWKQISSSAINVIDDDPACSRKGHNIPASLIAIEHPGKCGKLWIAFSEHAWSEETFKLFANDAQLRDRRMQTFVPTVWIESQADQHGLEGTQANIEQIIEYQDSFAPSSLIGGLVGNISKADGSHDAFQLHKETTRHVMAMRKGQSKAVADAMKAAGDRPDGRHNAPIILALWDAVGITHELNGFRNDAAGRIEQYHDERSMEISALNQIEGIKLALEDRAAKLARRDVEAELFLWTPQKSATRLASYAKQFPKDAAGQARQADLCARWEQDSLQKVPSLIAVDRERYVPLAKKEWEGRMAVIDRYAANARSAPVRKDGKSGAEVREENAQNAEKSATAEAWPKYEKLLLLDGAGKKVYKEFKSKYEKFMAAADTIMEERTGDLIAWLTSKSLIDSLTEFNDRNITDGMAFDDAVGTAVFGMNSSINGRVQIEAWVKEMRATEGNLLWRSIGLNNKDGIAELNQALQEAEKHKGDRTLATSIDWINYANKSLKALADTYKKCVSVNNTNTSALTGSTAFGAKIRSFNLRGTDKAMITFGDAIFGHVRINTLADHASEKIIQHILSIRAFVDPHDSVRLIVVQTQNEMVARGQLMQRFRAARTLMAANTPAIATAQSENLRKAWEEFKAKNTKGAANIALKDARLALLVMLIEGGNFAKLMADCKMKGDDKSRWLLAASAISITSALFEIASIPAKSLFGAESWSYQRLKGMGGILSSGAIAIGAVFDAKDAFKAHEKEQIGITYLYILKSFLGTAQSFLGFGATFTYAAPMIGRMTGKVAIGAAVKAMSGRAAAIIGFRVLFMSAGSWLTVGIFGVQAIIWIFSDDELQSWCALCAFGNRRFAQNSFKTITEQNSALERALLEVGIRND